ncbi:LOW QUALITY PROTEIN: hypothetical protein MXB_1789, partial [Myxobolus squamalis]
MSIFDDLIDGENVEDYNNTFASISVTKRIQSILKNDNISVPTEIQRQVIPVALKGSDIFACAETGSGKTLSYAIPLIQRMNAKPKVSRMTRCLIIVPTRELASQVFGVIEKLSAGSLSASLIVGKSISSTGGQNVKSQELNLRSGSDIIVCTPGRLIDHLYNCPSFCIENIEILVLDEADRLLDESFMEQLEEIIKHSSKKKQTISSSTTVKTLEQQFIRLHDNDLIKREALVTMICESHPEEIILIFCPTKKQSSRLFMILSISGQSVAELHGDMSQEKRDAAIDSFRFKQCRILVSTNLSSRGLDISCITLIINFTVPTSVDDYIHRVGRTARVGRIGRFFTRFILSAITIYSSDERKYWKAIKKGRTCEFSSYTFTD